MRNRKHRFVISDRYPYGVRMFCWRCGREMLISRIALWAGSYGSPMYQYDKRELKCKGRP